jgi:hypothetical protein
MIQTDLGFDPLNFEFYLGFEFCNLGFKRLYAGK